MCRVPSARLLTSIAICRAKCTRKPLKPREGRSRASGRADSPGSKKVIEQFKSRFRDLDRELGHPVTSLFGVGLDGNHFLFVRNYNDKWQVHEPVDVNRLT